MIRLVKTKIKPQFSEQMLILKTRLSELSFHGNVIVDVLATRT